MTVYVMGCESSRLVKIGQTRNPAKRLSEIRAISPDPVRLLWQSNVKHGQATERTVHRILATWRTRGEWFDFGESADPVKIVEAAVSLAEHLEGSPLPGSVKPLKASRWVNQQRSSAAVGVSDVTGDGGSEPVDVQETERALQSWMAYEEMMRRGPMTPALEAALPAGFGVGEKYYRLLAQLGRR